MPAATSYNPDNNTHPPPPAPPPPPPPPSLLLPPFPPASISAANARTPTRRLQWVKIPEVKIKNSNNVWSMAEKSKPPLDVNMSKVEQLFSYKVTTPDRLSNRFHNSSPPIGQPSDDITDGLSMRNGESGERCSFTEKRRKNEEVIERKIIIK